jgi:hypothetical protein
LAHKAQWDHIATDATNCRSHGLEIDGSGPKPASARMRLRRSGGEARWTTCLGWIPGTGRWRKQLLWIRAHRGVTLSLISVNKWFMNFLSKNWSSCLTNRIIMVHFQSVRVFLGNGKRLAAGRKPAAILFCALPAVGGCHWVGLPRSHRLSSESAQASARWLQPSRRGLGRRLGERTARVGASRLASVTMLMAEWARRPPLTRRPVLRAVRCGVAAGGARGGVSREESPNWTGHGGG